MRLEDNGGWAVSPSTQAYLVDFVTRHKPVSIVETGCGVSTLLFAASGASVTSLEHLPEWSAVTRETLAQRGLEALVIDAPLVGKRYSLEALEGRTFDLLFVDGPPGTIGREEVLPSLVSYLVPGAWVLLDDVHRHEESVIWSRWCVDYNLDARIIDTDRGLAVGRMP